MMNIVEETKNIDGWLMPEETEKLYDLAQRYGDTILEVGTFRGKSAAVLTLGAVRGRPKPQFYSVDVDPSAGHHAFNVLRSKGTADRAFFFHGNLSDFRKKLSFAPTLTFIDGDHSFDGVRSDVAELSGLLVGGTPVVFHDYLNPETTGVKRAVDEWAADGYATPIETFGTCGLFISTDKCRGTVCSISEMRFRQLGGQPSRPILVVVREYIRSKFPWLVPVVRFFRSRP